MKSSPGRVAVLGDVGGHAHVLWSVLERLGVTGDVDATLRGEDWAHVSIEAPGDLHVVQVGDLVHRGPDSLGVVALVDRLLELGAWTQVVGNHEQLYVDRPVFRWDERIPPAAADRLRTWWCDGRMVPGAVVSSAAADLVVTHAGVTAGYWNHGLGGPRTAADVLASLADARRDGALWHPGAMLTGRVDHSAGPVWANAGTEVYPSWLDADEGMPFSQAHGHSSAYDWDRRRWRADRRVRRLSTADAERRHLTFIHGEASIVGVDAGHGAHSAPAHAPLLVSDAVVSA